MLFFLFMLVHQVAVQANDSTPDKKYNLSICTIFKNEAKFFKEWIEYHRLAGVDHFYLYDNDSTDDYLKVLNPYLQEGIATLIRWPSLLKEKSEEDAFYWAMSVQIPAYENAILTKAIQETKWLMFLGVDEFLVVNQEMPLQQFLKQYETYPGVELSTDYFDAFNTDIGSRKLLIETVVLTSTPEQNIYTEVAKLLFKPSECAGFTFYPYKCRFKNNQEAKRLTKIELGVNRYLNRSNQWNLHFRKRKERLPIDPKMLSEDETSNLLKENYLIEDENPSIHRFIPSLLKKLELSSS
jgi:hypothetical protein